MTWSVNKEGAMKKICILLASGILPIIFCAAVYAESDMSTGEMLERQMWEDIKTGKTEMYEAKIAEGFMSVHEDGARGREQEIKLLRELNLSDYTLSRFNVTRQGDTLIVTYFVKTTGETIGGVELSDALTPRLSVWVNTEKGWQWLAHANLNVVRK
jgi:hypothetical protein